jgi:hypothetical protein
MLKIISRCGNNGIKSIIHPHDIIDVIAERILVFTQICNIAR